MLSGKNVLVGISGGIAAYKMANCVSMLVKLNADVHVVMTENATKIITPEAFEVLTKNKVYTDVFSESFEKSNVVTHIALAEQADAVLVAPATANIIGKIAGGIADDMLSTVILPVDVKRVPVLIAPSMNVNMFMNPIVQDNIEKLRGYGYTIIEPASGHLACGYDGKGKLPPEDVLTDAVVKAISHEHDLEGTRVLITAGPTEESIDPVRIITNHSSGKMGYALADAALNRGAEVVLVSGPTALKKPYGARVIGVVTAGDMYEAVMSEEENSDIIIMAAAVADYTPAHVADQKIKKQDDDMSISLTRTKDILRSVGEIKRDDQVLCGFSMETENLLENSAGKLRSKNADMICANSIVQPGAGYKVDTNIITIITGEDTLELPLMSKYDAANRILDKVLELKGKKND